MTAPRSSLWTSCQVGHGQTLLGLGTKAWGWGLHPVLCVRQLSAGRHGGSQCEVRPAGGSPFLTPTCPMGPARGLESPVGTCIPFSGERPFPLLLPASRPCLLLGCLYKGRTRPLGFWPSGAVLQHPPLISLCECPRDRGCLDLLPPSPRSRTQVRHALMSPRATAGSHVGHSCEVSLHEPGSPSCCRSIASHLGPEHHHCGCRGAGGGVGGGSVERSVFGNTGVGQAPANGPDF